MSWLSALLCCSDNSVKPSVSKSTISSGDSAGRTAAAVSVKPAKRNLAIPKHFVLPHQVGEVNLDSTYVSHLGQTGRGFALPDRALPSTDFALFSSPGVGTQD